ncbi:MAG: hypothetical protein HC851_19160 [Acaryochloris sp. RU_4_1]|nr:hypothetical protein [Acaryochloris sp. RU_4_1]NJR55654.1 hypothetical protein [Acaryochloris sp. CRU_2_0]
MQTAVTYVDSAFVPVRADGQPIEKKDADTWTLHILPKLYIPEGHIGGNLPCDAIQLTECSLKLGDKTINVMPSEVVVRRPYPNGDYYAAGTAERKLGWDVEISGELTHCQLNQSWLIGANYPQTDLFPCSIQHRIDLVLVATEKGHVFSLNQTDYFYDPNARAIGGVLPKHINSRHFLKGNKDYAIRREGRTVSIEQKVELSSCAWSDLLLLEQIEEMKLCRDADHLSSFTQFNEEHRNNACCELPASVMFDAVQAAQRIPYGKGTDYPFKDSESHPALKLISKWWNHYSPIAEYHKAAFCYFWVRVEDDDEYWPGQDECPNIEITNLAGLKSNIARFGDLIAIIFVQAPRIVSDAYGGIAYIDLVDGSEYTNVDADQYEALDALIALENFPGEFPAAWEEICRQAEQEWKADIEPDYADIPF